MSDRIQSLKTLSLLSHLSEAKLAEMTKMLQEERFEDGQTIFEEGSHGDSLCLVTQGQVRIEKKVEAAEGRKELALLSPGDFFGEMALIEETPRSARAVAKGETVLFTLSRKELFAWLHSEPVMALGFFVELMRVFSQRLRHTSSELALLFDVSHLMLARFDTEAAFLSEILKRVVPHLEGEWSAVAYIFNPFNEEFDRVTAVGPQPPSFGEHKEKAPDTGWLEDAVFAVNLPGEQGSLGFLAFRGRAELSGRERNETSVTLTTVAHLVSSALQNILHRSEEASRARLEKRTHGSVEI